jgi:hypothetical protein
MSQIQEIENTVVVPNFYEWFTKNRETKFSKVNFAIKSFNLSRDLYPLSDLFPIVVKFLARPSE